MLTNSLLVSILKQTRPHLFAHRWFQVLLFNAYNSISIKVMVKAMNCRIGVSEFVLQSRYYVHFRANTLVKGMKPLILQDMG